MARNTWRMTSVGVTMSTSFADSLLRAWRSDVASPRDRAPFALRNSLLPWVKILVHAVHAITPLVVILLVIGGRAGGDSRSAAYRHPHATATVMLSRRASRNRSCIGSARSLQIGTNAPTAPPLH